MTSHAEEFAPQVLDRTVKVVERPMDDREVAETARMAAATTAKARMGSEAVLRHARAL